MDINKLNTIRSKIKESLENELRNQYIPFSIKFYKIPEDTKKAKNKFAIQIENIFKEENISKNISGVYCIYYMEKCLYIGSSQKIIDRLKCHNRSASNKGTKKEIDRGNKYWKSFKKYVNKDLTIKIIEYKAETKELNKIEQGLKFWYNPELYN